MKTKTLLHVLLTTWLLPVAALADGVLPTGPTVVAGDVTITTPSATQMVMQQSSGAAIVDWGSFSIGAGNGVLINNGAGATLNRVTGSDLSSIMGSLEATGSVYLINRNGIVFGDAGVVDTGGSFVASTLDIADGDFLDGGDDAFAGGSDAFVINLGRISSLGGDVALLGRHVVNEGAIAAPEGTVGLVAGREILMRDASVAEGMFSVRIGGADSSVSDTGAIRAAAAELRANGGNVYALAGNTDGVIAATGVARVMGRVFLTAGDGGTVKVDKPVKATAADGKGGTITVNGGTVEMAGVLDASGSAGGQVWINSAVQTVFSGKVMAFGDGTEGSGGFAEVSGRHLRFAGMVDTGGGTVLIDPEDIEITNSTGVLSGASTVSAVGLEELLATQNVIITTNAGTGSGTIVVSDPVRWASQRSLSLLAQGDIWFLADVRGSNPNRGNLNIVAGWDGTTASSAFVAAPFLTADLATTSVFGTANGLDYTLIGRSSSDTRKASGSAFISGATVGVLAGRTRLFAGQVEVGSADSPSQLGFNITNYNGPGPIGDIVVRSTGHVGVLAGTSSNAAAQIGHIGMDFTERSALTIDASGKILIEAATSVDLGGGSGSASSIYAMIGHGSRDFSSFMQASGDRTGTITILAGQDVSIDNGSGFSSEAWIGHTSADGIISGADIEVTALSFDQDYAAPVAVGVKGSLDIGMLAQNTAGGNVTFVATDSAANGGLTLTGTTGGGSCECDFVSTTGDMIIQSAADIVLDSGFAFSNDGGGNVALAAGARFSNDAGASAFGTMAGRWLVYSTRPDINSGDIGTLEAAFLSYDTAFDPADPFGIGLSGNGLIYAVRPVVVVADANMIYSGALVAPEVQLTVGGVAVDATAFGLSLGTGFVDPSQIVLSGTGYINAGVYATALDATVTALPELGVVLVGFARDRGQLTVEQALLTGAIIGEPTKFYDGTNAATLTENDYELTGFALGEGATVTQVVGTYASANVSETNLVTVSLIAGNFAATGSTLLENYLLPETLTGNGVIDRRLVTVTLAGVPTKSFDGNTTATLTSANFSLAGFVAGEGASVTQTNGTYATAQPGAGNVVTVALTGDDFMANTGTLLSNYVLPESAYGEGFIGQSPTVPPPQNPPSAGFKLFETTPLGEPVGPALGLELISTETTQRIMDEINAGSNFCKALVKQEYTIDCLSDRLQSVADGLSATGEYSEVQAALQDAAQKLHALALQNASQDLAATIARAAGQQSSRALSAISTAALGAANVQAAAIIDGARLVLLRSSSGSERRSVAFTQVAQVVNSTKVLLRSS